MPHEDHARAPVLPPVVFLAALAAAGALRLLLPVRLVPDSLDRSADVAGYALTIAGGALASWALAALLRGRTTPLPNRPARALVTGGPYRFSRNPMYVGVSGVLAGLGLIWNSFWLVAALPPVWLVLTWFVIRPEEAYLARRFGNDYRGFVARTRRWI